MARGTHRPHLRALSSPKGAGPGRGARPPAGRPLALSPDALHPQPATHAVPRAAPGGRRGGHDAAGVSGGGRVSEGSAQGRPTPAGAPAPAWLPPICGNVGRACFSSLQSEGQAASPEPSNSEALGPDPRPTPYQLGPGQTLSLSASASHVQGAVGCADPLLVPAHCWCPRHEGHAGQCHHLVTVTALWSTT